MNYKFYMIKYYCRLSATLISKTIQFFHSEFGVEIPDEEKAKSMMAKLDAMNKDMFDEYVDGNGDGSATLDEIEMVSSNSDTRNIFRKWLDKNFDHVFREVIACSV